MFLPQTVDLFPIPSQMHDAATSRPHSPCDLPREQRQPPQYRMITGEPMTVTWRAVLGTLARPWRQVGALDAVILTIIFEPRTSIRSQIDHMIAMPLSPGFHCAFMTLATALSRLLRPLWIVRAVTSQMGLVSGSIDLPLASDFLFAVRQLGLRLGDFWQLPRSPRTGLYLHVTLASPRVEWMV